MRRFWIVAACNRLVPARAREEGSPRFLGKFLTVRSGSWPPCWPLGLELTDIVYTSSSGMEGNR